ncbi:MAG: hypothetical protein KY437_03775 [Actinobacteria bacterium]|nr:hypothetical protein [Actinomycetota bacterium]
MRISTVALATVLTALSFVGPVHAQDPETPIPGFEDCFQGFAMPGPSGEIYGPTDINAQTSNARMAVALNDEGSITVLRWPRPSFYDQIKYRTSSRDLDRFGALVNEGAFLGLAVDTGDGFATTWLRDMPDISQRHPDDRNDVVETTYADPDLGLRVTVRDVTAVDLDVLAREVTVTRTAGSPAQAVRLVAFENLNLVYTKVAYVPGRDWCSEELNVDTATYDVDADAIVHHASGVDESTGEPSSVAVAMAFAGASDQHQVGGDAHEGTALPAGKAPGPTQDAYEDAADGELNGGSSYEGQTTGALTADLDLTDGSDTRTVLFAGAPDTAGVLEVLDQARAHSVDDLVADKRAWFEDLLSDAPLPVTEDPAVLALANRALVTLVSVYDRGSGAIVASIATQSPYGEDWPRDGAFFDHALDLIGRNGWVDTRVRWYASLQSKGELGTDNPFADLYQQAVVPPGNWAMNYYADGVVGGPIPWEIDETGYTLWLFWDHYAATGDPQDLRDVYPAIRRAADFLTDCVDPTTGLQCYAIEDDNPQPRQTIHGAGPVWLGLDSAVKAAEVLGETADAERWTSRREELRTAIEGELYTDGSYGGGNGVIVWPVCFHPYDHERFEPSQYDAIWGRLAPTFEEPQPGDPQAGLYESKGLIALVKAQRDDPVRLAQVRRGLTWIAEHHAEPGTHIMGEEWLTEDGEVVSTVSQPHVWEQILFYLASLEAWPPAELADAPTDCADVIGRLRGDVTLAAPDGGGAPDGGAPDGSTRGGPGATPATGSSLPAAAGVVLVLLSLTRWRGSVERSAARTP